MPLTKPSPRDSSRGSSQPPPSRSSGSSGFHPFGGRLSRHFGETV
jgi:sentrin-specific protease 8